MKKNFALAGVVIVIASLFIVSYNYINTTRKYGDYKNKHKIVTKFKKGTKGADPAYEQYILSEKVPNGSKIPYGQRSKWVEHERQYDLRTQNGVSPFSNIQEYGPKNIGGRTRAIHIDPRDGNKVFAGGISGGLWLSNDRALSWQPINDLAPNLSITSITYNPFNPDIIYYSTGEPRGGGGIGEGIFKSIDNGQNFEQLASSISIEGFEYTWRIKHSLVDSNTVYVASRRGLFVSNDVGNIWEQIEFRTSSNNINVFDILPFSDGGLMISTSAGIYYSTSGLSNSFSQLNIPNVNSSDRSVLAYCKSQENVVYVMVGNDLGPNAGAPLIFKSIDRGINWTSKAAPLTLDTQFDYNMLLHVHPTDPNKVIAGAVVANQSNDGGVSWGLKNIGHFDYHAAVNFPDDENSLLIGNDGGLYEHRWSAPFFKQSRNNQYNTTQFYAGTHSPNNNLTVGGTQDNGTIAVKESLSYFVFGADGGYTHIHQQDPNIVYFSTQKEGLFRAVGIQQGTPIPTSISYPPMYNEGVRFINTNEMNYVDGNQLYYRTDLGLWRSINKGNSWQKINTSNTISNIYRMSLSKDKDPHIYMFGKKSDESNSLLQSKNGLSDSTLQTLFELNELPQLDNVSTINHDIHPNNNDRILFANYNYTGSKEQAWLLKNVNDVNTITNVTGNLPKNLPVNTIKFHPYDPDNIFIAGTDFGLYYSLDAGANWIKEDDLPNVAIFDIRIREKDGKVFFFTFGRGVWAANLEVPETPLASLPYTQNFETGNWDVYSYAERSNNYGRTKVNPKNNGSYNLTFDQSLESSQLSSSSFGLKINTSGIAKLVIQYDYLINESNIDDATGLYVSFDDGNSFSQIRSFGDYEIDSLLNDSLLIDVPSNSNTVLKFEYKGMQEAPIGGFHIDNIEINEVEVVSTYTSTNDLSDLKVYPNPSASYFKIDGMKHHQFNSIDLIGNDGKRYHQWDVKGSNTFDLPERISKGIYQLVFQNDDGNVGYKTLVID